MKQNRGIKIHQLPEFEEAGFDPSYEYALPAMQIPDAERKSLGPWLDAISRMQPAAAHEALRSRWSGRWTSVLQEVLDILKEYEPAGIVTRAGRAWLLCVYSDPTAETPETRGMSNKWSGSEPPCPRAFLIPEPVDVKELSERLSRYGFDNPLLLEFLIGVSGMREDFEPSGGGFVRIDEVGENLFDDPAHRDAVKNFDEWKGALQIFGALDGSALLVRQDGTVGWLGWREVVLEYAAEFSEFCVKYAQYRRTIIAPAMSSKMRTWAFDGEWPG